MRNALYLVSVGPGYQDFIAPAARAAIASAEVIVAYDYYLNWIRDWVADKQVITLPLTQEKQRVHAALEHARSGKSTALLSSGDIGIYGLAPLLFEEMSEAELFQLKVIPGISASNASASLLGAPLAHDFVTLSLSDLLCPWDWIEARARAAASADLCLALYNVQSKKRYDGIYKIIDILLEHKSDDTVCGVVRNAYRDGQTRKIVSLKELRTIEFDMFNCIIIGNRFTERKGDFMFTPRGYNSFKLKSESDSDSTPAQDARSSEVTGFRASEALCVSDFPKQAVWVFSGTSDGNALAQELCDTGLPVVVSAATEYGAETARAACPQALIVSGSLGEQRRGQILRDTNARLIVDATHPFAENISAQLNNIALEHSIDYVRFQRKPTDVPSSDQVVCVQSIEQAVEIALSKGRRVFLATGVRKLEQYVAAAAGGDCEWFVRLTPEGSSIDRALSLGIPRKNIFAMQGPFTHEMNTALWRTWKIDLVITKDSGVAGGLSEKLSAAKGLGIPIVIIKAPSCNHDAAFTFAQVLERIHRGQN